MVQAEGRHSWKWIAPSLFGRMEIAIDWKSLVVALQRLKCSAIASNFSITSG